MKLYVIKETSGYPFVTRDGQLVQVGVGHQFTEEELPTLTCTEPTTYMSIEDGTIYTLKNLAAEPVTAPIIILSTEPV